MAQSPVAEIIRFTPTAVYLDNPQKSLEAFLQILSSVDGFRSMHHGLQLEKSESGGTRGFIIILWETLGHHEALQKDSEKYPKLRASISPAAEDRSMFHTYPKVDPTSTFVADALEIAITTVKEGHSVEDLGPVLDVLVSVPMPGLVGTPTWGPAHEEKDKVVLFMGWDSIASHEGAIKNASEGGKALLAKINGLVGAMDVKHVKLVQ